MDYTAEPEYRPTIKELPLTERPRERLAHYGPGALSTVELLAIILRTGTAGCNVLELSSRLYTRFQSLNGLARASFRQLCQEHGLSTAKVAQLQAALELGRRMQLEALDPRPQILSPADAANLVMLSMQALDHEELRVILLDTKHRLVDILTISVGSLNASLVRIGELFKEAVRANCAALIVAHNHPSGDPSPSREDISLTRQIVEAGKLLDIEVLDHVVIGQGRFVSLLEQGQGFVRP